MKTVREMFVSLTAMLINHIWASIIEICVEKWHTQSLKKLKFKCPDMRNGIDLRRCPLHVPALPFQEKSLQEMQAQVLRKLGAKKREGNLLYSIWSSLDQARLEQDV